MTETEKLQEIITNLESQNQANQRKLITRADALAAAEEAKDRLEARLKQVEETSSKRNHEIFVLTSRLLQAQDRIAVLEQEIEQLGTLREEVIELKKSTSWRITLPLRKVKDLANAVMRKDRR